MSEAAQRYPLTWPPGWKRSSWRDPSQFKTNFAKSRDGLFAELRRMGVSEKTIILSTNVPLRQDGLPYAGIANPKDPGVAIYFQYKQKPMVFACDRWAKVEENIWAIAKTIEALRGIERWGASDMLERAFTGFAALPAPGAPQPWHEVLGVAPSAPLEIIQAAWKELAKKHHPDAGGSTERMAKINAAYKQAQEARR